MSFSFEITARGKAALDGMKGLTDDLKGPLVKAQVRGLNRVAKAAKTLAVREIAKNMGIKSKRINQDMKVLPALARKLEAKVRVKGIRIPLIEFKARENARGVTAMSRGKRKLFPDAFISRMKSGHIGVFKRFNQRRLPIAELRGASIPVVFGRKTIQSALSKLVFERLDREIKTAFDFFTRRRLGV